MTKPTFVFIHGGQHTKHCWSPTVDAIHAINAEAQTLPVNLPGHGDQPGDLATLTIAHCVESVVKQIKFANIYDVILVGHSMAGITVPGVAEKLGKERVKRIIFLACCIPPQGKAILDTLQPPMNIIAGREARKNTISKPLPRIIASWVFGNGMNKAQKQHLFASMNAESSRISLELVDRSGFPQVPMSWILPLKDRALRPKVQRQFIKNIGDIDDVVEINTCHDAMISEPELLAKLLLQHY